MSPRALPYTLAAVVVAGLAVAGLGWWLSREPRIAELRAGGLR